jgi:putative thioredoxin
MSSIPTHAPQGGPPAAGGDVVKDSSLKTFAADVIQPSMQVPVLVDFWAPWCGPCKTLGPLIEKVVRATNGKVRLVKINIDEPQNQPLAQQLRIQSIPAVYAFFRGQPVDGFVGALPESQIKQFIERLAGDKLAPDPVQQLLEHGQAALEENDFEVAMQAFSAALEHEAQNPAAIAGVAKALAGLGRLDEAEAVLMQATGDLAKHADIHAAQTAVALARESSGAAGQLGEFERAVAADPANHQARFDLAVALVGANRREDAVAQLLDLFQRDRKWNDEAAKKQLLKLFEAWGFTDPVAVEGRKRLSTLMFS